MHLYNDLMVNADKGLDVDGKPVAEGVKTKAIDDAPVVSPVQPPRHDLRHVRYLCRLYACP